MGYHYSRVSVASKPVHVTLIGCGGTGSIVLNHLARLHTALQSFNHPGIHVDVYDPDIVTDANIGRQAFTPADVGLNKATVLVTRINAYHGLTWTGWPVKSDRSHFDEGPVVITCVDNVEERRRQMSVFNNGFFRKFHYWLDCGNTRNTGQVILGAGVDLYHNDKTKEEEPFLPTVLHLFPNLEEFDTPDEPSCSLAEALSKQDLFINSFIANAAGKMLWDLFRKQKIEYHGFFINLDTGLMKAMPVDRNAWQRFGFKA